MISSKLRFVPGLALACAVSFAWASQTLPVASQEQEQQAPAEGDQAAPEQTPPEQAAPDPAPSDQAAPAEDGSGGDAQPSEPPQDSAPAPTETPQQDTASPPADNGGAADVTPVQPEKPAAEAAPAAGGTAITASQVPIGAAVFGADGTKIGEINGVKSDDSGNVQEILVTDGMPAGINAKVFEVPADKITSVSDGVKLSLSSEEAKQLPIIDNSNG